MYSITSTYGIGVLLRVSRPLRDSHSINVNALSLQESFTWDLSTFFENYPDTVPSEPLLVYWACQLAFYCSLLVTHFSNVRRKVATTYMACCCVADHTMTVTKFMFYCRILINC